MRSVQNQALKWSFLLFFFAFVAFLITGVLLDSALASTPDSLQRGITIALIVVPTLAGALLGVVSFARQPRSIVLSLLAVVLNGLAALFFIFLVMIAG